MESKPEHVTSEFPEVVNAAVEVPHFPVLQSISMCSHSNEVNDGSRVEYRSYDE